MSAVAQKIGAAMYQNEAANKAQDSPSASSTSEGGQAGQGGEEKKSDEPIEGEFEDSSGGEKK